MQGCDCDHCAEGMTVSGRDCGHCGQVTSVQGHDRCVQESVRCVGRQRWERSRRSFRGCCGWVLCMDSRCSIDQGGVSEQQIKRVCQSSRSKGSVRVWIQ